MDSKDDRVMGYKLADDEMTTPDVRTATAVCELLYRTDKLE